MSWRPPVFWGLLHSKFTDVSLTFEIKFRGADGGPGGRKKKKKKTHTITLRTETSLLGISRSLYYFRRLQVRWARLAKNPTSKSSQQKNLLKEQYDRRLSMWMSFSFLGKRSTGRHCEMWSNGLQTWLSEATEFFFVFCFFLITYFVLIVLSERQIYKCVSSSQGCGGTLVN